MLWVGFVAILLLLSGYTDAGPSDAEEFELICTKVKNIFDATRGGERMTYARYMKLHNDASDYSMDTNNKLFRKNSTYGSKGLFSHLQQYVQGIVDNIDKGEDVLTYYATKWKSYLDLSNLIGGIFEYMDRPNVKEVHLEDRDLKDITNVTWKERMFVPMADSVTTEILKLIKRERDGEKVDMQPIKMAIDSYIRLDANEKIKGENYRDDPESQLYRKYFERRFIDETENYFALEAAKFTAEHSVTEYMEKVETRLNEEIQRCKMYFRESTMDPLVKVLVEVLITQHLDLIQSEIGNLLESDQTSDLNRLLELSGRVKNGIDRLPLVLEVYIARRGQKELEAIASTANNNPKEYVLKILDVYNHFRELVKQKLGNEAIFRAALDKGCESFINYNSFSDKAKNISKSAQFFAQCCDSLLRKNSKSGTGAAKNDVDEQLLNQILTLSEFINDKDAFEKFYKTSLAKRLVGDRSVDDNVESQMVEKLKGMYGEQYTKKMEQMFRDIETSKDMTADYRASRIDPEVDFSVKILQSGAWPSMQSPSFDIPSQLAECMESFSGFYGARYSDRKLIWHAAVSYGELATTCFDKPYTLTATTPQITVLMLFNGNEELSLQHICDNTGLKRENVIRIVQGFEKAKLLRTAGPMADTDEAALTTMVKINPQFSRKKTKVDLRLAMTKAETQKEAVQVQKRVDDDRKYEIDAALARIMKGNKQMKHTELINGVLNALSSRFHPNVSMIKRRIEHLIEQGFLKRDESRKDLYKYVA